MKKFIAFSLVATLASCSWLTNTVVPVVVDCSAAAVQAEIAKVMPTVLDVLAGGLPNWQNVLDTIGLGVGSDILYCILSHIAGTSVAPKGSLVATRAEQYIKSHKW